MSFKNLKLGNFAGTLIALALSCIFTIEASAQTKAVKVTVTDEAGPLPGVSVIVDGTNAGGVTDINGVVSVNASEGQTLVVSFLGYLTQNITVGKSSVYSVVLKSDILALEETVVVGYATQKKVNLTGAVDVISSETMESTHLNSIGQVLQGQIPNLEVGIADGRAGRGASFNIRGTTSINGGAPLIMIDGIPSNTTEFNNLAPQDIESISVLKDAASAAIYGARGTYGVILVTTKKAKPGEFKISYTNNFTWGELLKEVEAYQDCVGYMEIVENEFNHNIGQSNWFSTAEFEYARAHQNAPAYEFATVGGKEVLLGGGRINNFYKEWFRDWTPKQNHHVSISGGGDKFRYSVSGDINHEEGCLSLKADKVNRYNIHSNIAYDFAPWGTVSHTLQLTNRNDDMANSYVGTWRSNIYRWMDMFNKPMWPTHVNYHGQDIVTEPGFIYEFVKNYSGDITKTNQAANTVALDLKFLDGDLKFHGDVAYNFSDIHRKRWADVAGVGPCWLDGNSLNEHYGADSYFERTMTTYNTFAYNAYATYDKELGNHNITVMAGMNYEDYSYMQQYSQRMDPLSLDQHSLNLGSGLVTSTDSDNKYANQSTFARINYNYYNRYLLELNGCYNVSSRFAAGNRDACFASASAAWRISSEPWFEPLLPTIGNLKLRASYGALGNQNIGSFDYLEILTSGLSNYALEGAQVTTVSTPAPKSSAYTWETAKTIDFGMDLSMFDNRFTFTGDWYRRNTEDMLANFHSLPSVYGAATPKENIASLKTLGWEISLGWNDKFKLASKDFNWGVKFVMSDYHSEITDYYNPTNYLGDYYIGQEMGEIWGLNTLGYFKSKEEAQSSALLNTNGYRNYADAGCIKFEDKNNDGVISKGAWTTEDHGDFDVIGNTTPRYQYGITLTGAWNGFDVYAFFKGIGKKDVYPAAYTSSFWGPYSSKYFILTKHIVENRWTEDNPDAYFPRPQGYIAANGGYDLNTAQTKYLQDASYFRLKNLVIGYTLPSRLTQKVNLSKVRFYVSGTNLFCLTNLDSSLDPEGLELDPDSYTPYVGMGAAYPLQRTYSFGIDLTF